MVYLKLLLVAVFVLLPQVNATVRAPKVGVGVRGYDICLYLLLFRCGFKQAVLGGCSRRGQLQNYRLLSRYVDDVVLLSCFPNLHAQRDGRFNFSF